jgi:hypothetical protein
MEVVKITPEAGDTPSESGGIAHGGSDHPITGRISRAAAWGGLECELAQAIAGLEDGHRLVLRTRADAGPRLELAVDGGRLRSTVPTDSGLAAWARLDRLAEQRLRRTGWHPPFAPGGGGRSFGEPAEPGWWRDDDLPVPGDEVAGRCVTVVRDILGVPVPSWLVYQGYTSGGAEVVFGGLHLERVALHPSTPPLAARVDGVLRDLLHVDDVIHDEDGDAPVRRDTAMYYVRADEDHHSVEVFSPMLRGVTDSPVLARRLNELNSSISFARMFLTGETVLVAAEVDAGDAFASSLERACEAVSWLADHWGPRLQREFGGTTFFESVEPSPGDDAPHVGLYL